MNKTLLKQAITTFDYKVFYTNADMDFYYDEGITDARPFRLHKRAVYYAVTQTAAVITCALFGHKWDSADGNPESGSFYMECSRCWMSASGYMSG